MDVKPFREFLDHTSELGLRVRAPSLAAVMAEAARGLAELQLRGQPIAGARSWRRLEVEARDREALLVDWLNELIFQAETDHWIGIDFEIEAVTDTAMSAGVWGATTVEAPSFVKAATHHGLVVRQIDGGVEAEVIFDI
jgi:SHS2 domain-containing protein